MCAVCCWQLACSSERSHVLVGGWSVPPERAHMYLLAAGLCPGGVACLCCRLACASEGSHAYVCFQMLPQQGHCSLVHDLIRAARIGSPSGGPFPTSSDANLKQQLLFLDRQLLRMSIFMHSRSRLRNYAYYLGANRAAGRRR